MADDDTNPRGFKEHLLAAGRQLHDEFAGHVNDRKLAHTTNVLEQFEADLAPLLAPMLQAAIDNPSTPAEYLPLLREAADPQHFSASLLIGVVIGAVISPVLGAVAAPLTTDIENAAWTANPSRVIPAEVAVATVLKGVLDLGSGETIARASGYNAPNFDLMVQAAGQSIGIAEALLLYRRQQIDLAHLQEIVQYSNINPKFYDDVPKLRYAPPTVGEVVTGALKGHLTDADAAVRIGEAGIDPVNFPWLKATAGRPISLDQALHLWNRELIDEARVDEIIRQSDINEEFASDAKQLRHYFPPPRSVVPMLRSNSITETQARTLLSYYGVDAEWVDAFIKEAQHASTSTVKHLSQAQIVSMYETHLIDRATASARLTALTYSAEDVALLLNLADEKRTVALQNATARAIGSKYVARKIDKQGAVAALGLANIPPDAQHDLFQMWDVERQANVHVPSAAAIVGAYRRLLLTGADTHDRLVALGVDPGDVAIFVADGFPPAKPGDAALAALAVVGRSGSTFDQEG